MTNTSSIQQAVPSFNYPMVNQDGTLSFAWYQFFVSLWNRTGGAAPAGNVSSVSITGEDGINATVVNPTGNVEITLGLGTITPVAIVTGNLNATSTTVTNFSASGSMKFGTYTNGTKSQSGWIQIIDSTGQPRNLLVG